jgi:hypothetical protein
LSRQSSFNKMAAGSSSRSSSRQGHEDLASVASKLN